MMCYAWYYIILECSKYLDINGIACLGSQAPDLGRAWSCRNGIIYRCGFAGSCSGAAHLQQLAYCSFELALPAARGIVQDMIVFHNHLDSDNIISMIYEICVAWVASFVCLLVCLIVCLIGCSALFCSQRFQDLKDSLEYIYIYI